MSNSTEQCGSTSFRRRRWMVSHTGLRWKLWDFLLGAFALSVGFFASPYTLKMPAVHYLAIVGGLNGVILMFCSQLCGVPAPEKRSTRYELISHALVATVFAYLLFSAVVWIVLVRVYGRYIVLIMEAIVLGGLILPRWLVRHYLSVNPLRLVVHGAGNTGKDLCLRLAQCRQFEVVGLLDHNPEKHGTAVDGQKVLGGIEEFDAERLKQMGVELVVNCVGHSMRRDDALSLLQLPLQGVEVLNTGTFVELHFREISVKYDNWHWFLSSPCVPRNPSFFAAKRLLDFGLGTTALLASLPFWAVIALLVKLDGKGPVFYRQKRVGWGGREFDLIKFRTMQLDAEKDGAQWAAANDPRVTRIGRFLRVTRLDELPQLWNVVKGDMALVGPRPERPEFVKQLAEQIPFYQRRHLVPPGLTGWAQIRYAYGASVADAERKLQYDLYYVKHLSLAFDLEILLRTIPLAMKGSR